MFVSIRVQGQPAQDPLREHLERRLRDAVRPFGARVTGVALRATTPTPHRAAGTTCRVAIALGEGGRVMTGTSRGANVYFAADGAIERAVRAAARALRDDPSAAGLARAPGPKRLVLAPDLLGLRDAPRSA